MAEEGAEAPAVEQPVAKLDDESLPTIFEKFHAVYKGTTTNIAKMASRAERAANPPPDDPEGGEAAVKAKEAFEAKGKTLMYCEVGVDDMHKVLNAVKSQDMPLYANKGLFLDLGSGAGKACVAAQLLHPFEKVVGVETLQCLHDFATKASEKQKELEQKGLQDVELPELQFIKGDFVQPPADDKGEVKCSAECEAIASQVAVCMCCSTSFADDQLKAMTDFTSKMPDGSYFIAIGQGLPDSATFGENRHPLQRRSVKIKELLKTSGTDPAKTEIPTKESFEQAKPVGWVEVESKTVKMPWGSSPYYLYKKIPGPFSSGNHWGLAKWTDGDGPWPQLVGLKKDDAETKLKTREDLKVVILEIDEETKVLKEPEPALEDGRVVIRYDITTGLVTEAPFREKEEAPPAS
jgi:SAM-dependent methyltransferase